jgi:hypothetical protein
LSNNIGMNRRQVLGSLLACATPLPGALALPRVTEECLLENEFVEFRLRTRDGKVVARRLVNKLANETLDLPTADFALEFDNGSVVTPDLLSVIDVTRAGDQFELVYSSAEGARSPVQVRVRYQLPRHAGYVRKQIELRGVKESVKGKLMRADLESWMGVKRPWQSMKADRLRFGSHPIFCDTFWGGVEFVAAFNEYSNEGFILRSRPGGKTIPADWVKLRPTVTGVAEPSGAHQSFMRYIEDVRLRPARLVANYNSWWSLPEIFHENEFVPLMEQLKERLYEKEGVFFDLVTGDMGWSDPRTIWKIDKANQPDDLNRMVEIVESAHGKPGLWMSPSEVYPPVIDYEWAKKNGYVVVYPNRRGRRPRPGISLADPQYRSETKESLKWLIKEKRLGHIKYDGFIAREEEAHHGLLPGDDSVEPLAEYSLELLGASREANPDLVTEPTYLNSHANYISPWIIKYADSVWGNAGGDCPRGIGPAPDYRESHTTAREYYIFSSLNEVWLPQNALQYFDIIHCDHGIGFPNHAAMAFGRGRFFVPTYLDPKYMTDEDWRIYAGMLKWARRNVELLRNTKVLSSRVEIGEPYAYAHWQGHRGIVAVRNPSNESKEFSLDLRLAGAPQDLAGAVCYSQYPYRKGIATNISASTQLTIELAPWELVFLEVLPRSELREPVAMKTRWYRDSSGAMVVAPPWNGEAVSILLPGEGEHTLPVKPQSPGEVHGEILSQSTRSAPEADWLKQKDKPVLTTSFELECSVTIPDGAKGRALFLLEFPGREHRPSQCSCMMNAQPAKLEERSSAGHIGSAGASPESPWKAVIPYESEWTWYLCEVDPGTSKLRFTGSCGDPHVKIAVWVWNTWNLKDIAVKAGIACPEPQMPQYREHLETKGVRLGPA